MSFTLITKLKAKTFVLVIRPSFSSSIQEGVPVPMHFSNLDSFYWEMGDGTISLDTNPWHIYAYPDTFLVSLIATDINGCTDTMTKEIYIYPPAVAGIEALDGCYADSSQLLGR